MTHTLATLTALYDDDPRKLDAVAAEVVLDQRVEEIQGHNTVFLVVSNVGTLPDYSTSLDAAALLEQALDKRDLDDKYADLLFQVACSNKTYLAERHYACGYTMGCAGIWAIATASPRDRTIAAILAAQEEATRQTPPPAPHLL